MKRILAMAISCLFFQPGFSQTTEFTVGAGGTVSYFRGADAASTSYILISDVQVAPDYTAKGYGLLPAVGAGVEATMQRVYNSKFLTGLSVAYERLTSNVKIIEVGGRSRTAANGNTKLSHTFINLYPFIGKRFGKKMNIDLNVGFDIGLPLSAHEKGGATTDTNYTVITDTDHPKPSIDLRPRLQLKVSGKHVGIQGGFSLGLTNYYNNKFGGDNNAYTNVFRLGFFYVL